MNDDEVVGEHTCTCCSICIPPFVGCVDQALPIRYCDCLDVRFALLTVKKPRRVCSNYRFLSEGLNMYQLGT
jgi:hypothetical protein